ncbi:Mor transcription activator family protein [Hydrogenimonas thermophila]|uniref:Mor transcription activator family protein n=1 Tax=Hydrogenimonas thermophila TaxID=223786 RepID=UPI0029372A08|nr:Mor transcription activator family protein [Hydrogenimonas thermophila]WOE69112.1 Mor transcription activator family protein [Hydrogenimonas thermophila]WOE71622.1 Mor transcription activator family protein [Hydrogenimonas thermophila]
MGVDSYELFERFYEFVKESAGIEDVIREFGGSSIYIPSFKNTHRNEKILKMAEAGADIREIMREFSLSEGRVRAILREAKQKKLFDG